jgi:hypothetical protein
MSKEGRPYVEIGSDNYRRNGSCEGKMD